MDIETYSVPSLEVSLGGAEKILFEIHDIEKSNRTEEEKDKLIAELEQKILRILQ